MGADNDKEIANASSIQELVKLLKQRRENFSKEREEIKEHIGKGDYEGKYYTFKSGTSDEEKQKRMNYMEQLEDAYGEIASIVNSVNNKINFDELKKKVLGVTQYYFVVYDKENKLPGAIQEFKNFVQANN